MLFGNTLHEFVTVPLISLGYGKDLDPGRLSRYSDSLRAGRSRNLIPVGAKLSAPVQTGPEGHPASYKMVTGSFSGVKRSGRDADHPFSVEGKERVELYLYSPLGLRGMSQGELQWRGI